MGVPFNGADINAFVVETLPEKKCSSLYSKSAEDVHLAVLAKLSSSTELSVQLKCTDKATKSKLVKFIEALQPPAVTETQRSEPRGIADEPATFRPQPQPQPSVPLRRRLVGLAGGGAVPLHMPAPRVSCVPRVAV